jgi:hypothetical protein
MSTVNENDNAAEKYRESASAATQAANAYKNLLEKEAKEKKKRTVIFIVVALVLLALMINLIAVFGNPGY